MTKYAQNTIIGIVLHIIYAMHWWIFSNVASASWDKDELIHFQGQNVKGQVPSMIKYAKTNHRV